MADRWPKSNFLIAPNAPIITGTIFVLTFHILLTLISRSLHLLGFSVIIIIIITVIASLFHNFHLSYIIRVILINSYANFSFYNNLKFPAPTLPPPIYPKTNIHHVP